MTVKELREHLAKMPDDAFVCLDGEDNVFTLNGVKLVPSPWYPYALPVVMLSNVAP